MIEVSEYYLTILVKLLADCHGPAFDQRDWELVDRINNEIGTLEQITKTD